MSSAHPAAGTGAASAVTAQSPLRLDEALKQHTRQLHSEAERSALMQALLRGRLDRPAYCHLLRNLQAIYAALETAMAQHAGHPDVAPLLLPGLARAPGVAADLVALHGPCWATDLVLLPAAQAYAARLAACARDAPELLVAHAYVRYLGDLNGGRILGRIVAQTLELAGVDGLRFYDFGSAAAAADLSARFRAGLQAPARDAGMIGALVAEAQWSFVQHRHLFAQLLPDARAA